MKHVDGYHVSLTMMTKINQYDPKTNQETLENNDATEAKSQSFVREFLKRLAIPRLEEHRV